MAQLSNAALQTIAPGASAVFTSVFITPQELGIILPNVDGSGLYLRGIGPFRSRCACTAWRDFFAEFYASFSANVQLPTGGTVADGISVAISVDGDPMQSGVMITNPADVETLDNISTQIFVPIPRGTSGKVTIENIGTQAIQMQNANLTVFPSGSNVWR